VNECEIVASRKYIVTIHGGSGEHRFHHRLPPDVVLQVMLKSTPFLSTVPVAEPDQRPSSFFNFSNAG
jgi:hypothetical protein